MENYPMNQVFRDGFNAFQKGTMKSHNPHSNAIPRKHWFDGWEYAANGKTLKESANDD